MDFNIQVISINKKRQEKYDGRYNIFQGVVGSQLPKDILDKYHTRWNAQDVVKYFVAGCSESHLKLLRYIIQNDLENVIVLEDDTLINWKRLEEYKDILLSQNEFVYLGGLLRPKVLKHWTKSFDKDKIRHTFNQGMNTIDTENYYLSGAYGYYIPNKNVAEKILSLIPYGKKHRAIDVEYINLQKKGVIKKLMYPACAIFHSDANTGFTAKRYKTIILDDGSFL